MKNYNMCVLIVTYKRSEAISDYLSQKAAYFTNNHIDIVIYDSSPDDRTYIVIEPYIKTYGEHILYVKYIDPEGDFYGAQKSRDALVECAKKYDYVWLCGDTTILQLQNYDKELAYAMDSNSDVIHVYTNNYGLDTQHIENFNIFFEKFFWSMTHWCSFILSSRIIFEMDRYMIEYLEKGYVNLIVFAIYAVLPQKKFNVYYINKKPFEYSICRKEATAYGKKDILRGYAEMISVGVGNLPDVYDSVKSCAMKSFSENTGLFSRKGVIELRARDNISFGLVHRYAKHIEDVTDVSIVWFYFCCMIPKRIACKLAKSSGLNRELEKMNCEKSKIVLYGAGKRGKEQYKLINMAYKDISIVAVLDKNWKNIETDYIVIEPNEILNYDYDKVVITIGNKEICKQVKSSLIRIGVSPKKIIKI